MELKFRRNFPCLLVVPAVCFGIARDPCRGEPRTLQRFNNSPEFLQYNSPICALNLEILYGRTLIESNSYHHHHHNGHEICFVLLCNTREHKICSWSEIIELVRFKLKVMLYQVLAWDTVIKYPATMLHPVGVHSICRIRRNKAGHYSKRIVFRCTKSFILYSENIRYQDHSFWDASHNIGKSLRWLLT